MQYESAVGILRYTSLEAAAEMLVAVTGRATPGNIAGRTRFYDKVNDMTAITESAAGRVITVHPGGR